MAEGVIFSAGAFVIMSIVFIDKIRKRKRFFTDEPVFFFGACRSAVLTSLKAACAENRPLVQLIEQHRRLMKEFEEICDFEDHVSKDDPRYAAIDAKWLRLAHTGEEGMTALCAYQGKTLNEARLKAGYLATYLKSDDLREHQLKALVNSFIG